MVKLLRKTYQLISRRQTNILEAAGIIMLAILISRLLGIVKYWLLATKFPPGELGVYIASFRLPEMIFELLVLGAVSTAFIPVFTSYAEKEGMQKAGRLASSIINLSLILVIILAIPILIFLRPISVFLAPGFSAEEISLMVKFTRIIIIAQVAPLVVGNFLTGILQSTKHFLVPAFAPVVYNIGIIIGIIFLTGYFGIYGPIIGVIIGAFLFLIIQIPLVYFIGYRHTLSLDYRAPGVRQIAKLTVPRTLGLAVGQIDTNVDLILASLRGAAQVTVFNFAQHLQQVPVGLFGASIAQAVLPTISLLAAKKDSGEFKQIFISAFNQILIFIIPISAMLIVLRVPIVRLAFGIRSQFDFASTIAISKTLAFFSLSLFAQSLTHLVARSFYALHDTKTPFISGAFSVVVNALLSVLFIVYLGFDIWFLGLSATIASTVNFIILIFLFYRRIGGFELRLLLFPALKIILSGLLTAVALYIPVKLLDQLVLDTKITFNLLLLTVISALSGLSVYLLSLWFLDVKEISYVTNLIKKFRWGRKGVIMDTAQEVVSVQNSNV